MPGEKRYAHLNVFLIREEHAGKDYRSLLVEGAQVNHFPIATALQIDGILFVKRPTNRTPKWVALAKQLTEADLGTVHNRPSAAVLFVRKNNHVFAFAFGYGRFLIDPNYVVSDFGIKTALNTLHHESLRSVDLYTVEDQALQRKAQAVRASGISVFGIDVFRDVLRAVTGISKPGIPYKNVAGGDSVFSFGIDMDVSDIPAICNGLLSHYRLTDYQAAFGWVDNIRRVKDKIRIAALDTLLVDAIKADTMSVTITIPEIVAWDEVSGFSFTRAKRNVTAVIEQDIYFSNANVPNLTVDQLKSDRLFIFDIHEVERPFPIYRCLYYECNVADHVYILFSGEWYEVDTDFKARIDTIIRSIPITAIQFPEAYIWDENGKRAIEAEADYNARVAHLLGYGLMDKQLIKSSRTTSSIELCDLLTENGEFVHVKHLKGGSAGLSHLFAQGSVAAEIMLGDRSFRVEARRVIRNVKRELQPVLPADGFQSNRIEIIYLMLGKEAAAVKALLPFFSKINLSKAYEALTQRGYRVSMGGVGVQPRPAPLQPV